MMLFVQSLRSISTLLWVSWRKVKKSWKKRQGSTKRKTKSSKRKAESSEKKAAKKQKFDEVVEELKKHLQIMPNDEDDVYTEATPLALKCQPMNEDYCYEQNSYYNSNSFGSDHCQPPQYTVDHPIFDAHNDFLKTQNELLTSQNTIMEQMTQLTSMCELACQIIQKKQKEKRIEEEQAAKARYWKIPAYCDDDDDYDSAITPILSTEQPINSLSMGDEHLDTIPATESNEVIKSSIEDLILIPSEFEGIPDTMCDVHLDNNHTPLEAKDHLEIVLNSNDDISSS
nr:hypothetical protein [Tanacetum cinerariifolium]